MKSHVTFRASIATVLIVAITGVASSPIQLQNGANTLQREDYAPIMAEYLTRYLEDRSNPELRNLDNIGGGHLLKQARRSMDAFSGTALGENKRFVPFRRSSSTNTRPGNFDEIDRTVFDRFTKRNIDEIDRSAFDSFYKRNLDEIDRVGWSGFVKRLDNYLNRQH